jgi:hypothetical protein
MAKGILIRNLMNVILRDNVSSEQDQQLTVRRLADGNAREASLITLNGQLLQIDLPQFPGEVSFKAGDLVEVSCQKTLYLGEVRNRQAGTMVVGVEHALDRETLAVIQQVWYGPGQ